MSSKSVMPVIWLSNHDEVSLHDQWDSGLFKLMFDGRLWEHFVDFEHRDAVDWRRTRDSAIFMLPARHHTSDEDVAWINQQIGSVEHCVLMLIGDEEATFPWREIRHPDLTFWVMMPHPVRHADLVGSAVFVGNGFREDTLDLLADVPYGDRPHWWAFAGQVTHARRKQAANGLQKAMAAVPGILEPSRSFTAGLPRADYLALLANTRLAPCPGGPVTPDTFRFYEALQAGCAPLADATDGHESILGYWDFVYGDDFPFPIVNDWQGVGGILEDEAPRWPLNANVAAAWWEQQKRRLTKTLVAWCAKHNAPDFPGRVTSIITSSPTPGTVEEQYQRLMETVASARYHFFHHQQIVCFDAVRPQQAHLADAYNEYVRYAIDQFKRGDSLVLPIVTDSHVHQVGLMRRAMEFVDTPAVLFLEHDTPLVLDLGVSGQASLDLIEQGAIDVLRYHHEAVVQPAHEHLMIDHETVEMLGVPLRRTHQWSARPHLASADYYRRVLASEFSEDANCFLEDRLHSSAQVDPRGHRIAIYHPDSGNIKRSYHTDGRAGQPKFDDKQVF